MSDAGQEKGAAPTTIIGSTIVIRGKLKSDEDLVVEGRIEAEITSTKALVIENSGIVKANMQVKSARVSGVVVGNITAESKVEIAPDGRVVGDILTPKLVIRDGAAFRGRIDMPDFDAPRVKVPEPLPAFDVSPAEVTAVDRPATEPTALFPVVPAELPPEPPAAEEVAEDPFAPPPPPPPVAVIKRRRF
jgi:cytoskeletal protein CcmA (bactofilin family)